MTYQDFFSRYIYDRRSDKVCNTRFGAIYKATERKKKREVFLRIMPVDELSEGPTLRDEAEFVDNLPSCDAVVRYSEVYRFEESTGDIDCAVMPFYPLGSLTKVLEDWKLDNNERRQLRDSILTAARFLREHGVAVGEFVSENVYISQDGDLLLPHFTDLGFTEAVDDETFARQVDVLLPVEPEPIAEPEPVVEPEPEPIAEVEPVPQPIQETETGDMSESVTDTECGQDEEPLEESEVEETESSNARKWRLLGGVAVTWIAIFGLIYVLHLQRNIKENHAVVPADSIEAPTYPADEFAKEVAAARADSIAKARADSIAAFKADSIAYEKKLAAEKEAKAREREEERRLEMEKETVPEQSQAKPAVPENSTTVVAPAEPAAPAEPTE